MHSKRNLLAAAAVVLSVLGLTPPGTTPPGIGAAPAHADALDKVARSGVLRVGTRVSARPFAFRNEQGQFAGFSVDLLHAIGKKLSERLGQPLDLEFKAVTTGTRLKMLQKGEVDLVCGLTTPTWAREKVVDFTVPFFIDGTRILTYRQYGQSGLDGMQGRRIGVLTKSTTERIVSLALPTAEVIGFDSMEAAMTALERRKVTGIANIGILLENLRVRSNRSVSMMLIPRSGTLHREVMACAVPQNESRLRDAINRALVQTFDGLEDLSGTYADIYFRWFGVDGIVYYPLTERRRDALLASRIWLK